MKDKARDAMSGTFADDVTHFRIDMVLLLDQLWDNTSMSEHNSWGWRDVSVGKNTS